MSSYLEIYFQTLKYALFYGKRSIPLKIMLFIQNCLPVKKLAYFSAIFATSNSIFDQHQNLHLVILFIFQFQKHLKKCSVDVRVLNFIFLSHNARFFLEFIVYIDLYIIYIGLSCKAVWEEIFFFKSVENAVGYFRFFQKVTIFKLKMGLFWKKKMITTCFLGAVDTFFLLLDRGNRFLVKKIHGKTDF